MKELPVNSIPWTHQIVSLLLFLAAVWLTMTVVILANATLRPEMQSEYIGLHLYLNNLDGAAVAALCLAFPAIGVGQLVLHFKRPSLFLFLIGGGLSMFMALFFLVITISGLVVLPAWKIAFVAAAAGALLAWLYLVAIKQLPFSIIGEQLKP